MNITDETDEEAIWSFSVDMPVEPPASSVVLDQDGYAWQARNLSDAGIMWHRVQAAFILIGSHPHVKTWRHLLIDAGPLRLIYRAQEEGDDGSVPASHRD